MSENYAIPTQSLLQRWLREKHNIHVELDFRANGGVYMINIYIVSVQTIHSKHCKGSTLYKYGSYKDHLNYEEALEKGLLEGLKLI